MLKMFLQIYIDIVLSIGIIVLLSIQQHKLHTGTE